MIVNYFYSKAQLEGAVIFIASHSKVWHNKNDYIRDRIMDSITDIMKSFPDIKKITNMGYVIISNYQNIEGIDCDTNEMSLSILVDPHLLCITYGETVSETYQPNKENVPPGF